LSDGSTVVVDETYVRESILNSQAKVVRGFQPLMPTFQGLISEEGLVSLIEYIRSLSPSSSGALGAPGAAGAPTAGDEGQAGTTGGKTPPEATQRSTPVTRKPGTDR
jgi:cytochrome c oxidase subunit II